MPEHLETQSVKIDADSVEFSTSTKGVVTFAVKRYTDFTTGVSGVKSTLDDDFWKEVIRLGKKAQDAFLAINGRIE